MELDGEAKFRYGRRCRNELLQRIYIGPMAGFLLRPFRMDDLPSLVKHANDPTVAANLTDAFPHPYTEEAGRAFLEQAMQSPPLRRCIEVNGACSGAIGLHTKADLWRHNLELGYWLAREHRGKGIMTAAIRQMMQLGFATFPEVTRIYATPFGSNIASQKALVKAGFTLEAKLIGTLVKNGKVEDEWIYAVRRDRI
jgi:RimJ/RimL family protein N-acetyltransferase